MPLTRRHFTAGLGGLTVGSLTGFPVGARGTPAPQEPVPGSEALWDLLLDGNKRFIAGVRHPTNVVQTRQALATAQHPQVIVLGCADSRLSPELIFDQTLGVLFVVRTAGHVADPVALGSLEYGAEHLHASLLVVLGHEHCGAVAAAVSGEAMPSPNLQALVDKIRPGLAMVPGPPQGAQFMRQCVEANVRQCVTDILTHSPLVRTAVAASTLTVVPAVYSLQTGEVVRLGAGT
jgi:carbonic anhydrase